MDGRTLFPNRARLYETTNNERKDQSNKTSTGAARRNDQRPRTHNPVKDSRPVPAQTVPATEAMETSGSHIDKDDSRFFVRVSEVLPSIQECHDFVSDPSCGAMTSFVGTTRDNFNGKVVTKLSYEGYVPMAEKELRKLCEETCAKYDIKRVAAVHVLGDCPVGKASVILACSSPHRRDALHGIEFLIDELKARVPIWKLEVYEGEDGCVWKENIEWKEGKPRRVMVKQG